MRLLILIILIFQFNFANAKGKHVRIKEKNRKIDTVYIEDNTLHLKTKAEIKPLIKYLFKKYKLVFPDGELDDTLAIDSIYNGFIGEDAEVIKGKKNIILLRTEREKEYNTIMASIWDKETVFPHDTTELFAALIKVFEDNLHIKISRSKNDEQSEIESAFYNIKDLLGEKMKDFEDSIYAQSGIKAASIEFNADYTDHLKHLEFKCSNNALIVSAMADYFDSPTFRKILDTIKNPKISIRGNFYINKDFRCNEIIKMFTEKVSDTTFINDFRKRFSINKIINSDKETNNEKSKEFSDDEQSIDINKSNDDVRYFGNIFNKSKTHVIINLVDQVRIYELKKDTAILKYTHELDEDREVMMENLNADSIPEILITTSPNMNGNRWFDVITYNLTNDTFINSGDLCCGYGYSKERDCIYVNHYGSYYMPVYHEIYKWDNYKLKLIEKIETELIQTPFQWATFTTYYQADEKGELQTKAIGWGDEENMIELMKRFKNEYGYEGNE